MKFSLLLIQLFIVSLCFGQKAKQLDSVVFFGKKYQVPEGCQTTRDFQLQCSDYNLQWIFMDEERFQTMPYEFMGQLGQQMVDFKRDIISASIMDKKLKGYKVSYKSTSGRQYQLIAYGVINGQPLLMQYVTDREPITNQDIPEFVQQFIKFSQ